MRQHILIEQAKHYVPTDNIYPKNYLYSVDKGYWINRESNELLMLSDDSHRPTSKKCDIETGEDQKGE